MKIFVSAKTGAKETKIEKIDSTHYIIAVKERPIKGKANFAIARVLAKHLKILQSNVRLASGASSKRKVFKIEVI